MTESGGKNALLSAFDRLFERAASKLNIELTPAERDDAKRSFIERNGEALRLVEQVDLPAISDTVMARMEEAIDQVAPAYIAAQLAAGPLALHVQDVMRQIAMRAAQQRMLEQLATGADGSYGGH